LDQKDRDTIEKLETNEGLDKFQDGASGGKKFNLFHRRKKIGWVCLAR
jgi:hypothetical protein